MERTGLVEAVRKRLEKLPAPYANAFGVVPLPPPVDAPDLRPILSRLEAAAHSMERVQTLATEMRSTFLISRVPPKKEAVASSAIENTFTTLDELFEEEVADELAETSKATIQVRAYAIALESLVPEARNAGRSIFTLELVQRLHRTLMADDPDYKDIPGHLRSRVVWIGGSKTDISRSTYNPTPPGKIAACLNDTLSYMRCDDDQDLSQSLITRMAIVHAHFEAVHPFRDGNGRVGRLMLPLMMAAEGLTPIYLSPYIEANKSAYYAALKAAQQRLELYEIVGFICDAVVATVDGLLDARSALEKLRTGWERRRKFRRGSASLRTLDLLTDYPVLTANRLANLLSVSKPAAFEAVDQLLAAGILTERTGYMRNRVFVAKEVLAIMNGRNDRAA